MAKNQSPTRSPEEWFRIITECRRSGLSDSAWCLSNGIPRSTFSQAVTRLRRMSYALPESKPAADPLDFTSKQEVVRVDIKQDIAPAECDVPMPVIADSTVASSYLDNSHTIEIRLGEAIIRLSNNADPDLVRMITRSLMGGGSYAC